MINAALFVETLIWGGVHKIPPQLARKLGAYRNDDIEIAQPIMEQKNTPDVSASKRIERLSL